MAGIKRVFGTSLFGKTSTENTTVLPQKTVISNGAKRSALGDIGNQSKSFFGTEAVKKASDEVKPTFVPVKGLQQASKFSDKAHEELQPMQMEKSSSVSSELPADVEDIDVDDFDNPQLVSDYVKDIYEYMRDLEIRHAAKESEIRGTQTEIKESMRSILIDWMVEVHFRFKLQQETLYLTVSILDRFLAIQPVSKSKLQLVGITSMLIASKYEEMYPPEVGDFIYIADNVYSRAEVLEMEALILRKLDFNLGTPLPLHFLRRFSKASQADATIHTIAKYLIELTLPYFGMINFKSSEKASAAIWMANAMVGGTTSVWNRQLAHYSGFGEEEIMPCVQAMSLILSENASSKYQAVTKKYANKKFFSVSTLPNVVNFRI